VHLVPSTDGVQVALHDLGGAGEPLLLCHATGFHAMVWKPLAARLAGEFHCYAPDLRHHGDAVVPEGVGYEWRGFRDDVLAVVDFLGLERPFGVGHSKGGAALLLAEEQRPGTFRSLYCFEPIVFPAVAREGMQGNPLAEGARRRREVFPSKDAAYENFAAKPPMSALHPDALRAYVDHGFAEQPDGSVLLKCRGASEAQVYEMSAEHNAFDHLAEVQIPVVVAYGTSPEGPPAAIAPQVAERLPHGRLVEFDHVGHFGPLEDPDAVAASIREAFDHR
jgi:pimeloyl-ACP methyl ester carboxylesterase